MKGWVGGELDWKLEARVSAADFIWELLHSYSRSPNLWLVIVPFIATLHVLLWFNEINACCAQFLNLTYVSGNPCVSSSPHVIAKYHLPWEAGLEYALFLATATYALKLES